MNQQDIKGILNGPYDKRLENVISIARENFSAMEAINVNTNAPSGVNSGHIRFIYQRRLRHLAKQRGFLRGLPETVDCLNSYEGQVYLTTGDFSNGSVILMQDTSGRLVGCILDPEFETER